jgi:hypothetical protein
MYRLEKNKPHDKSNAVNLRSDKLSKHFKNSFALIRKRVTLIY